MYKRLVKIFTYNVSVEGIRECKTMIFHLYVSWVLFFSSSCLTRNISTSPGKKTSTVPLGQSLLKQHNNTWVINDAHMYTDHFQLSGSFYLLACHTVWSIINVNIQIIIYPLSSISHYLFYIEKTCLSYLTKIIHFCTFYLLSTYLCIILATQYPLKTSQRKIKITVIQDMCAINDPLGQSHSPASSDHYSRLKVALFCEIWKVGRTYGQTTCAEIVITTGRDCGSASWINNVIALWR